MQIVGEFVVDALAGRGGHVGCHDEVALGEEEEDGDGKGGADAGVPVGEARFAGEVDPDEAGGDEDVDDGEGVGDEAVTVSLIFGWHSEWKNSLDQEVVRITWRRRQQDNNRHNPVLEETGSRRVERPVTSPDLRKGQDTLTTQFLDNPTLRENNRKHIAKRRQRDEHRHDLLSASTEHVSKESRRDSLPRRQELLLGHGSEIRDIAKHVEDTDRSDSHRGCDLQRPDRVLGFTQRLLCDMR